MKTIFLTSAAAAALITISPALAADLPVLEPVAPVAVVQPSDWTGFYLGVQLGYAFGNDAEGCLDYVEPATSRNCNFWEGVGNADADGDSVFAGAHVGADVQVGNFVFGGVLDANALFDRDDERGRFDNDTYNDGGIDVQETGTYATISYNLSGVDWYGTLRARAGFTPGRFLVYGTGGLAFGGGAGGRASAFLANDAEVANFFPGMGPGTIESVADALAVAECRANGAGVTCRMDDDDDDLNIGWSLGGGIEMLVGSNFGLGFEYLFVNLEDTEISVNHTFDAGAIESGRISRDNDFHTISVKGSYRF